MVEESDARFYVAPSAIPGAGQGLFARVPLPAGERLAVPGMLVPRGSAGDRYTAFADEYKFRVGDHLLIPCGIAAMANHSSQPNLRKVVEGETLFLELTRAVTAGEELCFAYSEYARVTASREVRCRWHLAALDFDRSDRTEPFQPRRPLCH